MTPLARLRLRVHTALEPAGMGDRLSRVVDLALIGLILSNGVVVVLETVPAVAAAAGEWLVAFERVSVTIFAIEYLLRAWSCTAAPGISPVRGRLRYLLRPLLLVDLAAILPALLLLSGLDLRILRLVRLTRLLRLAKLGRYSAALQMLGGVMRDKREELLLTLLLGGFALVMSSSLVYYAEHAAQPDIFSSIPQSFWWAVTTLTTVGYGDAYPITGFGRVIGAVAQILGVGLFALPAGILAGGYLEALQQRHRAVEQAQAAQAPAPAHCPHCGQPLERA